MNRRYIYEKIDHSNVIPFKCFVTSLESSCPHWHNDYELILLLKGKISVRVGGTKYNMNSGDIMLVNSEEIHTIFDCEEGNITLFIQFHPNTLLDALPLKNRRFYFHLNSCDKAIRLKTEYNYFVKMAASIWLLLLENYPGYELHLRSKFYQFLGDLLSFTIYDLYYTDGSKYTDNNNAILDKLTGFIEKNFTEDLNSEEICRHLGMSRSTLYRFMQNTLGLSLNGFIRYYRIERAKKLLQTTDYCISYISTLCGYSNEMTFYRAFKKETNKTPQDFRKENEHENSDGRIQGYVTYNINEAYQLIKNIANDY